MLILDEPTAGLDPKQIIETRQLIKELGGDHTVILSTHILPEVSQTCDRVVIINKGRVVAIDTPENLTSRLQGSETMFLQVDAPVPTRRPRLTACLASRRCGCRTARDGDGSRSKADRAAMCAANSPRGDRQSRLGPPGTAPDAHEPRRDLPASDDRRYRRRSRAAAGGAR